MPDERESNTGAFNLVAATLDAAAKTSECTLCLTSRDGFEVHSTGPRPQGELASLSLETPDGIALLLEGDLPPEKLVAVGELTKQAIATFYELTETRADLGRSRQELSLLYEFSQSVLRVSSVEAVVERFLFDIVNVLSAKEGTLLGIDLPTRELRVVCHYGSTPETINEFSLPLGQGIAGKVAEDGIPRLVNDTSSDPDYIPGVNPIRNVICAPIRISGEIVGVVSVNDRRDDKGFEPSHLKLLTSLVRLGEVGLENARLFGQVRGLLFKVVDGLVKLVEERSPQSVGHARRVARLSYSLGRHIGLARQDLEKLYLSALVHDLGAPIADVDTGDSPWQERPVTPNHLETTLGAIGILETAQELTKALPGLHDFRLAFDGSSDVSKPRGERLSLEGRVIAVAHAFDDALQGNIASSGTTPAEALEALKKQSGTRFDPNVVEAFDELYDSLGLDGWIPPNAEDEPWQSARKPKND